MVKIPIIYFPYFSLHKKTSQMQIIIAQPNQKLPLEYNEDEVVDFLYTHLEQYGDEKKDIRACIQYALNPEKGGFVTLGMVDGKLAGVVIINHTGMKGFIPSNILVYIAVDASYRGQGIGKQLVQKVIEKTEGGIALHVEPDNPAKKLYERLGFTNKYLEMRYAHD